MGCGVPGMLQEADGVCGSAETCAGESTTSLAGESTSIVSCEPRRGTTGGPMVFGPELVVACGVAAPEDACDALVEAV